MTSLGAQTTELESERLSYQRYREAAENTQASLKDLCHRLEQRAVRAEGEASLAITAEREGHMKWMIDRRRISVGILCDIHVRRRVRFMKRGFMRWRLVSREEKMRIDYSRREAALRSELLAAFTTQLEEEKRVAEARLHESTQLTARVVACRDMLAEERFALKTAARGGGMRGALMHWRIEQLSQKVRSDSIAVIND